MAENDPAPGVQKDASFLKHGPDLGKLGDELCVLGLEVVVLRLERLDLLPLELDLDSFTFLILPHGKTLDPKRLFLCLILFFDALDSF